MLKGPALRQWLYDPTEPRASVDLDLLVAPSEFARAERLLRELGFDREMSGWSTDAHGLCRADGDAVDLHRSLPGIGVEPAIAWAALSADAAPLLVAGTEAECLSAPARALHLGLHAFQHPEAVKPHEDLERGIEQLDLSIWRQAAQLARSLEATAAFTGGLRSAEAGSRLADGLVLPPTEEIERPKPTGPGLTIGLILSERGWRRRLARAAWHAVPPPAYLRSWAPLARRGPLGLALAYALRPFVLLARLATAWASRGVQRFESSARNGSRT